MGPLIRTIILRRCLDARRAYQVTRAAILVLSVMRKTVAAGPGAERRGRCTTLKLKFSNNNVESFY